MTASELKRKLAAHGCTFKLGKRHTKVLLGGRRLSNPAPPSAEIKTGTLHAILKQLGIDKDKL